MYVIIKHIYNKGLTAKQWHRHKKHAYFSQINVFPTKGNHFPSVEVTESHRGCGKRLVKSYNRNLHCPMPNPKPLVFPHVVLERFVV